MTGAPHCCARFASPRRLVARQPGPPRATAPRRARRAGRARVDRGRRGGWLWAELDDIAALRVPAALAKDASAPTSSDASAPSARRGILEWVGQAKRPATRARRVAETAEPAEQNVLANQWPRR
jgi:uncharacterized protein YdeI (YjbR/CyaY-like superfamily)